MGFFTSSAVTTVSTSPSPTSWRTNGSAQLRWPLVTTATDTPAANASMHEVDQAGRGARSASRIISSNIIVLVAQISSASSSVSTSHSVADAALAQFGGDALPFVAERQQLAGSAPTDHSMSRPCAAKAALNATRWPSHSMSARASRSKITARSG